MLRAMQTLFGASNHWALWAIMLLSAWVGVRLEHTRLGAKLSGAVITILATFLLSNLRVIPAQAPAYDAVWAYLVPLAIPLLLLRANLRRVFREAGPTLLAFLAGGVGTILGTLLAVRILPLGPHGWQLAGIFAATYIGGSMNYVGAAEALGLRAGDLLSAGIAADNLMMMIYFLVLFALPSWEGLRRRFAQRVESVEVAFDSPMAGEALTRDKAAAALAFAGVICAAGYAVEALVGLRGIAILVLTALVVAAATLLPQATERLAGAEALGALLMQVFFAAIGASADVRVVIEVGPVLLLLAMVILSVHLATILAAGWLMRLDLAEIVIASQANMGGPTTAAAMAVARRWRALVVPAILCGTLGYATATFIGVALGHAIRG